MSSRHGALDGLRAVAILWVAIYHYAVFWAPSGRGDPLLPYGDALTWLPFARVGDLGVALFFIVSGAVIALSLERSAGVIQFAQRRLIRLWPMLLICGTITFLLISFFGPAALQRSVQEALISMLFLPPSHVGALVGQADWQWLDGAYWSLWVEVRFYVIAALLWMLTPRWFFPLWCVFALACGALYLAGLGGHRTADAIARLAFAEYHPYFTAGLALAALLQRRWIGLAIAALGVSFAAALGYANADFGVGAFGTWAHIERLVGIALVFALAVIGTLWPRRLPLLSKPAPRLVGRASYGYYLLHQNAGLALLAALPLAGAPAALWIVAMIGVQLVLLGLAIGLHLVVERPLGSALRGWTERSRVAA